MTGTEGTPDRPRPSGVARYRTRGVPDLHHRFIRDARSHDWEPAEVVHRALRDRPGTAPPSELSWLIASGSTYAEQVGMDVAAGLLHACPEGDMKLVLATAVADEAKHSAVFHHYAHAVAGSVKDPGDAVDELSRDLWSLDDYTARFLAHTLAEGFAADEFRWFDEGLRGDGLGEVYRLVRRDESRHVALGMAYLTHGPGADRLRRLPAELLLAAEQVVLKHNDVDKLASLVHRLLPGTPAPLVAARLRARHATRMRVLLNVRDDRQDLSRHGKSTREHMEV
ncbi:ferritin-like domain-containing protein [Kitasatospora sp. NPDC058444]|uniref:ferritin-like domain-containing protein n=1 Tax=Kitasatospora sp. NPDC058444 TaxID=3346504 RepID=UPI0036648B89